MIAKTGAIVRYCGHDAEFVADLYDVGSAVVVRAAGPINEAALRRPCSERATHHVVDFPEPGFWRPDLGVLVVPKKQVKVLRP